MTTPLPQQPAGDGITAVLVALARVEGKLDAVTAQHGAKLEEHARRLDDQSRRSDEIDARVDKVDDRVRAVEIRPTVTPGKMLAAVAATAAVVGALSPFLDKLYS